MSRIYSHSSTPVPVRAEQDEDGSATALQKILLTRSSVVLKLRKIQHMVRSLSVSTWIRRKERKRGISVLHPFIRCYARGRFKPDEMVTSKETRALLTCTILRSTESGGCIIEVYRIRRLHH